MADAAGSLPTVHTPRIPLLARLIATRPWAVLLLVAAASVAAALQVIDPSSRTLRLRIDPSFDALIVPGISARAAQDEIEQRFGEREQILVVLRAADVYRPQTLGRIHELTRSMQVLRQISDAEPASWITGSRRHRASKTRVNALMAAARR